MINGNVSGADIKHFMETVKLPFANQEGAMKYHDVHSDRYAITLNALSKVNLPAGAKVLELAASHYGMSAYLCTVFGDDLTLATYADKKEDRFVDIGVSEKMFRLKEFGFNVEQEAWPFEDDLFDLVIACEIIEHLAMDPMALFAGANRVLKPGGFFFVSTPNAASIQNFLKLGRLMPAGLAQQFRRPFSIARLYERHSREYTPFTIGEMFGAAGFEIALMETDSAFPVIDFGFSQDDIDQIIKIIGIPELRRDTVNVVGRKIGPVVQRYPYTHELYSPEDE